MKKIMSIKKKYSLIVIVMVMLIVIFICGFFLIKSNLNVIGQRLFKIITISSMQSEFHGGITYYYNQEVGLSEDMRFWYNVIIPETDEIVKKYFKNIERDTLDIVTFNSLEEMTSATYGINANAFYINDTIYVNNETINKYTFIHEYAHYFTDLFCIENGILYEEIPVWYLEGIAEYITFDSGNLKLIQSSLDKVIDFRGINTSEDYADVYIGGHDIIFQSYLAIEELIQLKGKEAITRILLNTKKIGFYSAFEQEVEMSLEDFQHYLLTLQ